MGWTYRQPAIHGARQLGPAYVFHLINAGAPGPEVCQPTQVSIGDSLYTAAIGNSLVSAVMGLSRNSVSIGDSLNSVEVDPSANSVEITCPE